MISGEWIECQNCEDGFSRHDCGDDTCCCADPELNVICATCSGYGGWRQVLEGPNDWFEKGRVIAVNDSGGQNG